MKVKEISNQSSRNMDKPSGTANSSTPMTEQQKVQQQLQIFQNSLPKVSQTAYMMLLNECIPLSMVVEEERGDSTSKLNDEGDKSDNEGVSRVRERLQRLDVENNTASNQSSHQLCRKLCESDEEKRKRVLSRIRNIGFEIGNKITELLVFSNNPNLQFKDMDLLAVMKFICRDVWRQMFNKQVDNLKTNHRGTFYLFDYDYQPIQSFALDNDSSEKELQMVKPFLEIAVGLIKGVLASIGHSPEDVICLASYVDRPDEKPRASFSKGVSFHVQITA